MATRVRPGWRATITCQVDDYALSCFRKAGKIASECREWAKVNVKPGVTIRSVLETVETMIRERGGEPGFPAQSSRNYVAAHYCSSPFDEQTYEEGDCVKVDFGVHVDGYIADTAATIDLSKDKRWTPLIEASRSALVIGRLALQASISPLQKRLKPPPVPLTPTVARTPRACLLKSSVMASESG